MNIQTAENPKIVHKSLDMARELLPGFCANLKQRNYHLAFIWRRNRLLSIGKNDMTRPCNFASQKYRTIHAEIDAISKLWGKTWITGNERVVVIRLNRHGELRNSKPCARCQSILSALNINKVWYSTLEGIEYARN